jgi:photosystem II stability/assembly factor-like uncharacterized protein
MSKKSRLGFTIVRPFAEPICRQERWDVFEYDAPRPFGSRRPWKPRPGRSVGARRPAPLRVLTLVAALLVTPLLAGVHAAPAYTWRNVVIEGGGFVTGIVFHPSERDLIYARTDVGGAYRWEAVANQWVPITDWIGRGDSNYMGIESIAVDSADPDRVYLAAGTYTQSWAGTGAFLRSDDRGLTWNVVPAPFKMGGNEDGRSNGERLAVDPNAPNVLFFASRKDGLWRSADFGDTWDEVSSFPVTATGNGVGMPFVIFDDASGSAGVPTSRVYVGASQPSASLYRTTDAGATWQPVPGQPTGFVPHHAALDAEGMLFLTYGDGPGPNGVTNGAVWKHDTIGGGWTDVTPVRPAGSDRFGYAGLSIDPARPGTLVVSTIDRWNVGDDIFRSTNGGRSWTGLRSRLTISSETAWTYFHSSSSGTTHWMGDVDIDPFDSDRAFYVTGWGLFGTDTLTAADSGGSTSWTFRNDGLEETVPLALISPPEGAPLLSALGDIGGFRHDDPNASPPAADFFDPVGSTNTSIDFGELAPEVVARVHWGDSRGSYSTDGGGTWANFGARPPAAVSNGPGGIAVSADGKTFVWLPKGSVAYVSTNRGSTWKKSKKGPTSVNDHRTTWPTADRVNPKKFYVYDLVAGRVYASTNGGKKLVTRATVPADGGHLRAVPGLEGNAWLPGGSAGLYRSTDSCVSFARVAGVEEAYQVGFGKAAQGRSHPAVFMWGKVDGVVGIFLSDDEGARWTRINDDEHQYGWINAIIGDPRTYGRVYLATGGRGIVYGEP